MKREEIIFDSRDGKSKVYAQAWIPEEPPVCILQIVHGMAEHIERYEAFAEYLAGHQILVVGDDHLGHGKTAENMGIRGYFCEKDPATVVVRDEHRLKKIMQEKNPGVPYFILGHSMGSFIARNYLCMYGSGIQGAIIMGTGMQPKALLAVSKVMARMQRLFCGAKHPSKMINAAAFGSYNKGIENAETFSWLSRNEENVKKYNEDEFCGFLFTVNGFETLFDLIWRLHDSERLAKMPKGLPVFFVAGKEDPVGNYGKAVQQVYTSFQDLGMKDVSIKLYENDRHEILQETDRDMVFEDIYQWLVKKL